MFIFPPVPCHRQSNSCPRAIDPLHLGRGYDNVRLYHALSRSGAAVGFKHSRLACLTGSSVSDADPHVLRLVVLPDYVERSQETILALLCASSIRPALICQ